MNQAVSRLITEIRNGAKVVFLGVGSPLRADDSVGLYIVNELMTRFTPGLDQEFRFYLGESAPENFSGEIRNFGTTHLMIVDAAELGKAPGTLQIIEPDRIGGTSFSTHMLPLKMLTDYLVMTTGCKISILGIQPQNLEFGQPLSEVVRQAADEFLEEFLSEWERAT